MLGTQLSLTQASRITTLFTFALSFFFTHYSSTPVQTLGFKFRRKQWMWTRARSFEWISLHSNYVFITGRLQNIWYLFHRKHSTIKCKLYFKSDCLSFGIFVTWGLSIASPVVNNLINGEKCTGIYLLLFDLFGSNYDIRLKVICHIRSTFKPTQNSFRMLSVLSLMTICTALHFMLVRCMFDLHMYLIDLETLLWLGIFYWLWL